MKKLLQWLFRKPVTRLADKLSSAPEKDKVFSSLTQLLQCIRDKKDSSGPIIPFDWQQGKFIIFSDQHKGARDMADDFRHAEKTYLAALQHYYDNGFLFINLGDCEELWENKPAVVMKQNTEVMKAEARFLEQDRYCRIYGNHDLEWKYDIQRNWFLKPVFGNQLKVYEGTLLTTNYNNKEYSIFLAHGHQGDQKSDGNAFSTWFVAAIWTPIQRFLEISIDTIADSFELVDKHNIMMYEWSATQQNLLFVSGHTHKPVFASLDHIERLTKQLDKAQRQGDAAAIETIEAEIERRKTEYAGKQFHKTMVKPTYFNSGCCCFGDGDITGIEIDGDNIRLVKWDRTNDVINRFVLEQSSLSYIFDQL